MKCRQLLGCLLVMLPIVVMGDYYKMPKPSPLEVHVPNKKFDVQKFKKETQKAQQESKAKLAKQHKDLKQIQQRSEIMSNVAGQLVSQNAQMQNMIQQAKENKEGGGASGKGKKATTCDCYNQRDPNNFATNFIFDKDHRARLFRINPFCKCLKHKESRASQTEEPVATRFKKNAPQEIGNENLSADSLQSVAQPDIGNVRQQNNQPVNVNMSQGQNNNRQQQTSGNTKTQPAQPSWNINYR